jgi:hypothetical protein
MLTLKDSDGNTWTVSAVGFDGRGRALFELRDSRGLPAPRLARLSLITLMSGKRSRRWLRYWTGVDVVFDADRQHCARLSRLARELNA